MTKYIKNSAKIDSPFQEVDSLHCTTVNHLELWTKEFKKKAVFRQQRMEEKTQ